jgi:hypothetical protein
MLGDEAVLMRSRRPLTITEHRFVTPGRARPRRLAQASSISLTGKQVIDMTCRDSATKGSLLSIADPAAWALLSPARRRTAPDYTRWHNRLDHPQAYEPDLSTTHLVSPEPVRFSSDGTSGTSMPCRPRAFDAVTPQLGVVGTASPVRSEDDESRASMHEAASVASRLARREPLPQNWRPRRAHQRAALRAWRGGQLVYEAGRTHGRFERVPLPVAFNFK